MSASTSSKASVPASISSTPTSTGSALTTDLLVLIAPSQTFNGSVIAANEAATTYLINFPDSNALGSHNNATLTVGPASAATGTYNANISVPNLGEVTANCDTSSATPTQCVLTVNRDGVTITTTSIPSNTILPVTITAGLDKLSAASTVSPSSTGAASSSSSSGVAAVGVGAPGQCGNGIGLVALLGMFLGRWFL